jgi:hypothetical protein
MRRLRAGLAAAVVGVVLAGCGGATPTGSVSGAGSTATPGPPVTAAPSPTPSPTPPPTPTPSPTPVPTPTPVPLPVSFTAWSKTVRQGHLASATIKTVKSADCSIKVTYSTVVSEAKGLSAKSADLNGVATWTWTVGSNTETGTWPIEVTCVSDGRSGTATKAMTVTN